MEPLHGEASCSSVLGQPTLVLRVACREVAEAAPARPATPLRVLLALDRSGSMSGSPIQAAKRAACVFAQHVAGCASELALAGLGLLCFDNQVEAIDLFGQPASSIERLVRRELARCACMACGLMPGCRTAVQVPRLPPRHFLAPRQALDRPGRARPFSSLTLPAD